MKVILVLLFFTIGCIKAFSQPQIGVYLMSWIGYMNPHRLIPWSFVYTLPLAAIAFGVTVVGYIFYKDKPKNWFSFPLAILIVFLIWSYICTLNALFPEIAINEMIRFLKIQLIIFLTVMLIRSKEHIIYLVWVIFLSIGYYGIKGGVFTVLTGGSYLVWGPPGSFIEGNNELALAILIILPFGYFLMQHYQQTWIKRLLLVSMLLIVCSVIGSHSRGALLALITTGVFLWFKSNTKLLLGGAIIVGLLISVPFIPDKWIDRMQTIETYQEDASAMGRINAWSLAINVANDRVTSGGFGHWGSETFSLYAPNPEHITDAHSIYFEVLGELGYVGLILFLLILYSIWFGANKNINKAILLMQKHSEADYQWVINLNKMLQVSLVAYMSGGAFLGLAYWDLPYHLLALVLISKNSLQDKDNLNVENYSEV